jgi:uncharacterized protein
LFPEALLDLELGPTGSLFPRYLTPRDHLWVEHALDELDACAGLRASEALSRLRPPGLGERPRAWRALVRLLLRIAGLEVQTCLPPRRLRATLFELAATAATPADRDEVIARAARAIGLSPQALMRDLYADLPAERRLRACPGPPSATELIERYNLALAQGVLLRCETLRVRLEAQVRAVVRLARLQRLLCVARRNPLGHGTVLHLSGPLSLFHHTTKYGRAMAAWLPVLGRSPRWELEACCRIQGERRTWRASYRDPIATTRAPPRRFDSEVEERFFRDLRRLTDRWQVLREADAVQIGGHILCPDFTLVDRQRQLRVDVEIVGFWTPEYVARKLALLRQLPADRRWVLCVDRELAAAFEAAPPLGPIFPFQRRIPAAELLAFVEQSLGEQTASDGV